MMPHLDQALGWPLLGLSLIAGITIWLWSLSDDHLKNWKRKMGPVTLMVGGLAVYIGGSVWYYFDHTAALAAEAAQSPPPQPQTKETDTPVIHNIVNGNSNIIGNNNTVTNYNTINQQPKPAMTIASESGWEKQSDGSYLNFVGVKITNAGSVRKIRLTARGDGILGIGFFGEGHISSGNGGQGAGFAWIDCLTPVALTGLSIGASHPTTFRVTAEFDPPQ
jgi:hypothetical protein